MKNYHINKILVPSDLSQLTDAALKYVGYLAKPTHAEVEMLHVVHADYQEYLQKMAENKELVGLGLDAFLAEHMMSHLSSRVLGTQLKANIHAEIGFINDVIIETAEKSNSDLIVMGYYNDLDGSEMSARIMDVIYKSPCPVLAIQPDRETPQYDKIIVPLRDREGMFEKMQYVVGLAKSFNANVHLVPFFTTVRTPISRKRMNDLINNTKKLLGAENITYSMTRVPTGKYVQKTLEIAQEEKGDLIVILADQSGFFQKLFGNADEKNFLRLSRFPIMTTPLDKHLRLSPARTNILRELPPHLTAKIRALRPNYV